MNPRERFLATMLGKPCDRPPFWLYWWIWGSTWERWQREGLPKEFRSFADVRAHFGAEEIPRALPLRCGPWPDRSAQVAEDAESVTFIDSWGIRRRNLKGIEGMSEFIEWPVRSRDDWKRYRDQYLNPEDPSRLETDWRERGREWMKAGIPVQLGSFPDVGIFGSLRWLLGDEECLMTFCEDPDWVHEIMGHMTDLYLAVFRRAVREVRVDLIHLWEDMCGKQGPLISPAHWREFMGPCYRRIADFAREHQIPVISVDTDGQPDLIVPPMMEAGVNYLFPMEVAAGADVNEYRKKYPGLALMGGIDKRALALGPAAIDAELERIRPALESGRYIPDLDHHVPDDVSWPNFCHYATRLRAMVVG
ncbi:MAG TPA: uroporphyrinogen decarboxylase family protein [Opitutaceae bacterium]|nr:uroporphyrinogen decarboxylase family protein [Opitutaceae bacterium]HND62818.1 uroporphyrinogen decarboxylase family protein [Opitutaceae bacterium]